MSSGLGIGLEVVVGESMCDTLGVDLEEVGLEGGSVQWLMIVEFVFGNVSFTEARGVFRRGASAKDIRTSQF